MGFGCAEGSALLSVPADFPEAQVAICRRSPSSLRDQLTSLPVCLSPSLSISLSPSPFLSPILPLCLSVGVCLSLSQSVSPLLFISLSISVCFSLPPYFSWRLCESLAVSLPFLLHLSLSLAPLPSCDLLSSALGERPAATSGGGSSGDRGVNPPHCGLSPGWCSSAPLAGENMFFIFLSLPRAMGHRLCVSS